MTAGVGGEGWRRRAVQADHLFKRIAVLGTVGTALQVPLHGAAALGILVLAELRAQELHDLFAGVVPEMYLFIHLCNPRIMVGVLSARKPGRDEAGS